MTFPNTCFPPFKLRRQCAYEIHGDELLSDETDALKNFADIFGVQFFQARDDNQLINQVTQVIGGGVRNYPGDYWIEFEIKALVYKILGYNADGPKLKKVASQVMTGDPKVTLGSSFGRWLNKFDHKKEGALE